ncbi:2-C-methyl-D-erythritol 4-phosphate cytidylyltransferase [Dyadobacter sp. Leaf189]|uniref:2-C-methyl-D-erythritol 4-phosphate cytidylyltransferase n=1 Tax=Dyadobacter sp. Leaf189 TaxID=1736295 RepID=UPI0006F5E381|nr:2-C-methyl-D-erythritol 4-phosphate cytidylyltransferase [Dyadobacter sp. Leaf189]KQS24911.1 2-C-methyl-D-erythritol 4-phosphate cytidylyltransferase [Dyadobacter sp. Leaf189]
MQEFAVLVAGGSGSRMKSDVPKQFLVVNGLPVLMHTILAFRAYSDNLHIILVLPETQFAFWQNLCAEYRFNEKYFLVAGGNTRFHSVQNGLKSIGSGHGLVAVHDGVRPVISKDIIAAGFHTAREFGSAVTSVPLKESIRTIEPGIGNKALDRTHYRLVQTPQTFRLDWMSDAFSTEYQETFTDCASVLESKGYPIQLIDGAYENIKITTPEDLRWAETYLRQLS